MPNINKSAAVPFVNQKGERSMKRVKVERYVAGKKPAYAKDDDEDVYTTDDEDTMDDEKSEVEDTATDDDDEAEDNDDDNEDNDDDNYDDSDEEDPRLKMLKQVKYNPGSSRLLANQINALEDTNVIKDVVVDEDEEEEEEDIRTRHALARSRALEEPLGPQIMMDEFADKQLIAKQLESELSRTKKEETEDILKDLKLTGIKPKNQRDKDESKTEESLKEMLEAVKQEATIKAQLLKKIEEDNKRELEKETLAKGDVGAYDMETVKTDDEDDDLAYEEWKLREIKRVLRNKFK